MASQPIPFVTPEQYLEWERESPTKHEYFNGEIIALSGSSFDHNLIASNILRLFGEQLKGRRCREFGSDLRMAIGSQRLICYPDVLVACPPFEFLPQVADTLVNPVFVVEILSHSTRSRDRSFKLPHYREITSLKGYLLIEQEPVSLEFGCLVSPGQWTVDVISDIDAILELPFLECRLPVSQIYADVSLPV